MKIYSDSLSKINLLQNYMESDNLVVLNTSVTTTSRYRTIAIMHFSLNKKHGLSDEHSDFVVKITNNRHCQIMQNNIKENTFNIG